MNDLCDSIIKEVELDERLENIENNLDHIRDLQEGGISFFGLVLIVIITMVTNLWAQFVYNNFITNYGRGTHNNTDSLIMMLVFTIIGVGLIILYSLEIDNIPVLK